LLLPAPWKYIACLTVLVCREMERGVVCRAAVGTFVRGPGSDRDRPMVDWTFSYKPMKTVM